MKQETPTDCDNVSLSAFSADGEPLLDAGQEDSDATSVYLNDKIFPPSAIVHELRAARSILGMESFSADTLIETLAEFCHAGELGFGGWEQWLSLVLHSGGIRTEQDLAAATNLGNALFDAFDTTDNGSVPYAHIVSALAFLCGGSPVEERLMVAVTVIDGNCDGRVSSNELIVLVHSALQMLYVCSPIVADKVVMIAAEIGAECNPLLSLAEATVKEALASVNMDPSNGDISFETVCAMADDFLKLAAIF